MNTQRNTRMTVQRKILLEELRKVKSHPTADEIYTMVRKRLPKISLGTVYRNLDLLAENGEILRLERAGAQMRFDGNPRRHYHVRCEGCGRVGDVYVDGAGPAMSDAEMDEAERKADVVDKAVTALLQHCSADGFTLTGGTIEFQGLCGACASKS